MQGPIATIGSMHICPMCSGPVPHVGGPVSMSGAPGATINGKPIALMGDMCVCTGPPDVIAQGSAGATINGIPIATVNCMTAHGGMIVQGEPGAILTTNSPTPTATLPKRKIPFPKITIKDRAIAARAGQGAQLKEAEANQDALAQQAAEESEPEDSTEVTLTTTFAQDQLVLLCKSQPKPLVMAFFIKTFGRDIPTLAFQELYDDIQANAPVLKAPLKVKKSIPFGGRKAAFYSNHKEGVHEIFVAESLITEASKQVNNELRGELMTMLVEEYGHYLDYLLRHHYAATENKDAQRDEGARFAYKLYSLNPIEQADQIFAEATVDGSKVTLTWDYTDFHNDLKQFVNENRQNQEDKQGNYEFYKAGFLKAHGQYGHGNIEEEALRELLEDFVTDNIIKDDIEAQQILDKIYLGNWMRDFSQMADPMVIRPMAKGMEVVALASSDLQTNDPSQQKILNKQFSKDSIKGDVSDILKDDVNQDQKVKMTLPENLDISYFKDGSLSSLFTLPEFRLKFSEKEFAPVKVSVNFIATALELLAAKEFVRDKDGKKKEKFDSHEDFTGYLKAFRDLYTNGNELTIEDIGVYRPEEHIDNPKGLGQNPDGSDRCDREVYDQFVGKVSDTSKLHDINLTYGMKNYIRSTEECLSTGGGTEINTAYSYIKKKLKEAVKGGFDDTRSLANLGAALHTLEDYFAHSNYSELCLIKLVEPAVFPWADRIKTSRNTFNYKYSDIVNGRQKYDPYLLFDKSALKSSTGVNHPLAACIPVVTGTFGLVDTAASVLPLVNEHLFGIEIEPWERAACNKNTFADILMREMAKDMDANITYNGEQENLLENAVDTLLQIRNMVACTSDILIPDIVKEGLHYVSEYISMGKNFMFYFTAGAGIAAINDAQVATNKDLDIMASGSFSIGTDPSHTQVAKDDTEHPLHELSSQLAIEAVKHIGGAILKEWEKGGKNAKPALDLLDLAMRHPSVSDWQDKIVVQWAKKNKDKVCAACSPSLIVERIFHTLEHLKEGIKAVDDFVNNGTVIDQLAEFYKKQSGKDFDVRSLKEDINESLTYCNFLVKKTEAVHRLWDEKYPKPMYCTALLIKKTQPHRVISGETLTHIAEKYNTTVHILKSLNPHIIDINMINRGDIIKVPAEHKEHETHTHSHN